MKYRSYLLALLAALSSLTAQEAPGQAETPGIQLPQAEEIYEVRDFWQTAEYLLERAVNCQEKIWLHIAKESISQEAREKLFYLLPSYRIAGLKVYPYTEELFLLMPEYKSCVRILQHTRGHHSITLTEKEQQALQIARQALQELRVEQLSQAETARALHDWIILHAAYDVENANFERTYQTDEYTPFDGKYIFLEGKGVCDSYVQAYWLLLQMSGVPCSMISGYVPQYKQGHAWNLVHMDDHWAHVDTTFDDPAPDKPGQVVYANFDKTDEEMSESRTWAHNLFPNTKQNSFLSAKPQVFGTMDELITWLTENALPTDKAMLVEIANMPAHADTISKLQQAAQAAGIRLAAAHDPLYPHALRLRPQP